MKRKNILTISNFNYFDKALVMFESFSRFNSEFDKYWLIYDKWEISQRDREKFFDEHSIHLISINEIGIDFEDFEDRFFRYDPTEMATSVKPNALKFLIELTNSDTFYIDPDIYFLDKLPNYDQALLKNVGVLTPHFFDLIPRDARGIKSSNVFQAGIYNLGFLGIGLDSLEFLKWWSVQTKHNCYMQKIPGLFTDQKWFDLAVVNYDFKIEKNLGMNVAYWNLHERNLKLREGKYYIDESPLVFFHFSGFDIKNPHLLSKHQGDKPRHLISESSELHSLLNEYSENLLSINFQFSVPNLEIEKADLENDCLNFLYTDGFSRSLFYSYYESLVNVVPLTFSKWIRSLTPGYISNIFYNRNPDLDFSLKNGPGVESWLNLDHQDPRKGIVKWLNSKGYTNKSGHESIFEGKFNHWNLIGYQNAATGVGEFARMLSAGFSHSEIPFKSTILQDNFSLDLKLSENASEINISEDALNIWNVNLDQIESVRKSFGHNSINNGINIGVCFWELSRLDPKLQLGLKWFDGIWVASNFILETFARYYEKRLVRIPTVIDIDHSNKRISRDFLKISADLFVVLVMFDFNSVIERKNPYAAIESFLLAFGDDADVLLLIKSSNSEFNLLESEALNYYVSKFRNIQHIDTNYPKSDISKIYSASDCHLSMHRSEGLGLNLMKSMKLGVPVIATNYSGNTDYMNEQNSLLVDFNLVEVGSTLPKAKHAIYSKDFVWADPNIQTAAKYLVDLKNSVNLRKVLGDRARTTIDDFANPLKLVNFLNSELLNRD
jgi:glycosyltransferase involved in cell wall biosynthesis